VKKLPSDERDNITPVEALKTSTMKEWYDAKHRESSKEEIDLINSFEQSIHTCEIEGIPSEIKDNEVKYKDQFKEIYTSIEQRGK
jgi:hypothetical protein